MLLAMIAVFTHRVIWVKTIVLVCPTKGKEVPRRDKAICFLAETIATISLAWFLALLSGVIG